MDFPFNDIVRQKVYQAVADDSGSPDIQDGNGGFVESALLDALNGLPIGKKLASSPLIKVLEKDEETITFLVRGRIKFAHGTLAPFVRIEATFLLNQLGLDNVRTFIADLQIKKPEETPVTEVKMGLGYDGLVISGRGGARVVPIGLGLEIFLGGLSDRGIMLGIDLFLPAPIPLGPTGLGLNGLGGDYAHNFKPRLEAGEEAEGPLIDYGQADEEASLPPEAVLYVQWARNPDDALDRWIAAPINETAVGIGLRAFFCDLLSAGTILSIEPLGFCVLTPGPVIVLGGQGKLLKLDSINFEAYAVIDAIEKSFSLGGSAELRLPDEEPLVEIKAFVDTYFSFTQPSTWFIQIGTPQKPNKAKILEVFESKSFFEINNNHILFGVEIDWTKNFIPFAKKIFSIFVRLGIELKAIIGWNPKQLAGLLALFGEAGIKVWKFKLSATLRGEITGHLPKPKILKASLEFKINLPWPLPDPKIKLQIPDEEDNRAPQLFVPLIWLNDPNCHSGALHKASARQWDIDVPDDNILNQPWPDIQLVVHFSRRVIDNTNKVQGAAVSSDQSGGFEVSHRLTLLELFNLSTQEIIQEVQARWANVPDGGETAQLHILASDPYPWMYWNGMASEFSDQSTPAVFFQTFGKGERIVFDEPLRFREVQLTPLSTAVLSNLFDFVLPFRTITTTALQIDFTTSYGHEIPVDKVRVFLLRRFSLGGTTLDVGVHVIINTSVILLSPFKMWPLSGELHLFEYDLPINIGTAITGFELNLSPPLEQLPFHLYAVAYREARQSTISCEQTVILQPGRYQLSIGGSSQAVSNSNSEDLVLSEPESIEWGMVKEFEVTYPPSVRPYIKYSTIGDNRLFGEEEIAWNPTLFGIGFPAYRSYLPAIRFRVAYLSTFFHSITFMLIFEGDTEPAFIFDSAPVGNKDEESSLLEISHTFQEAGGCTVAPDQEIVGEAVTSNFGAADIRLLFTPPDGQARVIDQWSCYISRFNRFIDHLSLASTQLKVYYNADGPQIIPTCFTPGGSLTASFNLGGNHLDTNPASYQKFKLIASGPLLSDDYPITSGIEYPDELDEPPLTWRLPSKLAAHLNVGNISTAVAFSRFAVDTGARFYNDPNFPLFGLNNTVAQSTVEGIADDQGRFYALWLRTPEPVDWRRVEVVNLRIRHLLGQDSCAKAYAFRKSLNLNVEILPSPDASSAFLVGNLKGIRTRLPRGEYELTLAFHAAQDPLPKLRPSGIIDPEVVTQKFLILNGPNWPSHDTGIVIPAADLQTLTHMAATPSEEVNSVNLFLKGKRRYRGSKLKRPLKIIRPIPPQHDDYTNFDESL